MDDDFSIYADADPEVPQPTETHLEMCKAFVQEHKAKLSLIEDACVDETKIWDNGEDCPVGLHLQPTEIALVADLVRTNNDLFDKIITVFGVLCDEIHELESIAKTKMYPMLSVFGEGTVKESLGAEDANCAFLGRAMASLQDAANFVDRCNAVTMNMVHQLAALYQGFYKNTFMHVNLVRVFQSFGDLMKILITIDSIVIGNDAIERCAHSFRKLLDLSTQDPVRYGFESAQDKKLERFSQMMYHLNASLLSGDTFSRCIEQDFEVPEVDEGGVPIAHVRHNKVFLEAFFNGIKSSFSRFSSVVTTRNELSERTDLVGVFGLFALYRRLVPARQPVDEVFYRELWASQKKLPVITLFGKSTWMAAEFLQTHVVTPPIRHLRPRDLKSFRKAHVKSLADSVIKDVHVLNLETATWMVRFEEVMQLGTDRVDERHMQVRGKLMIQGIRLAHGVGNLLRNFLNTHMSLEVGMAKRCLKPVCRAMEILKGIESMFRRKMSVIAQSMKHIVRVYQLKILDILESLRKTLRSTKQSDLTLDLIAALRVVETTFHGTESLSFTRLMLSSLCFDVLTVKGMLRSKEINMARLCFLSLETLHDFQNRLVSACDCSLLFWSLPLLDHFLDNIYAKPPQSHRLYHIMTAFQDPLHILMSAKHVKNPEELRESYAATLKQAFQERVLQPLCRAIDSDLRGFVMSVTLDQDNLRPNPKTRKRVQHGRLLALKPFRIADELVDVKESVTRYLDAQFYNLTTVGLHNWKLYGEMKNLAREIYDLDPSPSQLPMGTLGAGLDVLQIMRNIDIFVARYNYNLNEQCFVERSPDKGARHLNTINVHSIANSMRTHGTGMMNTTVNYTYGFLMDKFKLFTQFMMDEYVKSKLLIHRRWFEKHKNDVNNEYPYEKAVEFNDEIAQLGITEDGQTFIDKFRLLITEIGNAMGFIRMERSASLHYCANAIKFVPDVRHVPKFEKWIGHDEIDEEDDEDNDEDDEDDEDELDSRHTDDMGKRRRREALPTRGAGLSESSIEAAKTLDDVLAMLSSNYSEGTDYLQVLVFVNQKSLDPKKNPALALFYIIIPSLIINHTARLRMAKDQMEKMRSRSMRKEAYFTDDGFALGLAYLLAILKQNSAFDSLHWFHSMTAKLKKDALELEKLKKVAEAYAKKRYRSTKPSAEEEQALAEVAFKEKRLRENRRETELFFFSFSGARIFFKEEMDTPPKSSNGGNADGDAEEGA